jgi:hypothetical protein
MAHRKGYITSKRTYKTVEPKIEIIISKSEVIYTNYDNEKIILTRVETTDKVYWMNNDKILPDYVALEESYKMLNRDLKIEKILEND